MQREKAWQDDCIDSCELLEDYLLGMAHQLHDRCTSEILVPVSWSESGLSESAANGLLHVERWNYGIKWYHIAHTRLRRTQEVCSKRQHEVDASNIRYSQQLAQTAVSRRMKPQG